MRKLFFAVVNTNTRVLSAACKHSDMFVLNRARGCPVARLHKLLFHRNADHAYKWSFMRINTPWEGARTMGRKNKGVSATRANIRCDRCSGVSGISGISGIIGISGISGISPLRPVLYNPNSFTTSVRVFYPIRDLALPHPVIIHSSYLKQPRMRSPRSPECLNLSVSTPPAGCADRPHNMSGKIVCV